MRVIAGTLGGRTIPSPLSDGVRPTTDLWRSTIFSAMEIFVSVRDSTVLDLCCGSGAFGIECLSRGAEQAVFVDSNKKNLAKLELVLDDFGVLERSMLIHSDAIKFLQATRLQFGIVFADPPYSKRLCNSILFNVDQNVNLTHDAIVILEHSDMEVIVPPTEMESMWHKTKGGTTVDMYGKRQI